MEKVIANCHHCGKELRDGDECLTYNQLDYWCMDCYDEFTEHYKEAIKIDYGVCLVDYEM
jgi:hypothetical protein